MQQRPSDPRHPLPSDPRLLPPDDPMRCCKAVAAVAQCNSLASKALTGGDSSTGVTLLRDLRTWNKPCKLFLRIILHAINSSLDEGDRRI